jgi:hypothetical protein
LRRKRKSEQNSCLNPKPDLHAPGSALGLSQGSRLPWLVCLFASLCQRMTLSRVSSQYAPAVTPGRGWCYYLARMSRGSQIGILQKSTYQSASQRPSDPRQSNKLMFASPKDPSRQQYRQSAGLLTCPQRLPCRSLRCRDFQNCLRASLQAILRSLHLSDVENY